jgi:DNA polymerase II small subunit/DNA polymerase delta subunit B
VTGFTVIETLLDPEVTFVPLHVSVYVEFAVGLTVDVPDVPFVPDQAPEAVQVVALVDDQVIVVELPDVMVVGDAEMFTETTGGAVTAILIEFATGVVFAPLHVSVYVEFAVGLAIVVPDVALVPDHAPEAVQAVAFVLDHVIVDEFPDVIDVGDAERVTVARGEDATTTVTD